MDLEREDATFGLQDPPGPRLEGPARRLHLHRVRPLPGRLPGLEHRQAAQPQDVHHGHPGHVGRGGARARPHPELADRARDVRPRRRDAADGAADSPIVDDAIPYDAVWDCVTCGACVEACPVLIEHVDKIVGLRRNLVLEESRFPAELDRRVPDMERPGQPVGPAGVDPDSTGRRACRSRSRPSPTLAGRRAARRARGPVLGRLRGRVRRAQPARRAGLRDVPRRGRRPVRDPRPGGVVHRRSGPPDGQRLRLPDARHGQRRDAQPLRDGRADDRHGLPALLQHDRERVRPARRHVTRWSTTRCTCSGCSPTAGCGVAEDATARDRRSVTLHDSCYLARYNGVDRRAARRARAPCPGSSCARWRSSGKNTFCCGAGGGRMWMEETRGTRINAERTRQALDTGASTVATSCPFCMTMLKDGLAAAESNTRGRDDRRHRGTAGRVMAPGSRGRAGSCLMLQLRRPRCAIVSTFGGGGSVSLGVGILGSGYMGRTYAFGLKEINHGARLVAVAGGSARAAARGRLRRRRRGDARGPDPAPRRRRGDRRDAALDAPAVTLLAAAAGSTLPREADGAYGGRVRPDDRGGRGPGVSCRSTRSRATAVRARRRAG